MNPLCKLLKIEHPIIMAPMFLVSNTKMMVAALNNGISAAFPALNYRSENELRAAIQNIKQSSNNAFGVNLIVNSSNFKLDMQLKVCLEEKVDYVITSLGSPKNVIKACKEKGILVFCDVTNLEYAQKVEAQGADALIAVNSKAGGHCGDLPKEQLIPLLKQHCKIPIISAGGVSKKEDVQNALDLGAAGVSVGTVFIATNESDVSLEYKNAIVDYGAKDIVLTKKMSGSHLTVINTPYVQKLGTEPNFLEKMIKRFPFFKKLLKFIVMFRGMKKIRYGYAAYTPGVNFYTVKNGDYLYKIAQEHGVSIGKICSLNGIRRNHLLTVGEKLQVTD